MLEGWSRTTVEQLEDELEESQDTVEELRVRCAELEVWVRDLQKQCYVNCVYCGHRYGPEDGTPVAMADVLKQHIAVCPKHPMSLMQKSLTQIKHDAWVATQMQPDIDVAMRWIAVIHREATIALTETVTT